INGAPQQTTAEKDRLQNTIRTSVPLKITQRHSGQGVDGALLQDLRIYGRALSGLEVEQLAKTTRAAWLAAKPPTPPSPRGGGGQGGGRTADESKELFDWWLTSLDKPYQELAGKLHVLQQEEAAIKSRGSIAYVMQERPQPAMAYVLYRGEYDKRRDPVKPDTPKALPPMPADSPKTRLS